MDIGRKFEFSTCKRKDKYEKSERQHEFETHSPYILSGANLPLLTCFCSGCFSHIYK